MTSNEEPPSWSRFFASWFVTALGCFLVGIGGATLSYGMWMEISSMSWFDWLVKWEIGAVGLFCLLMGVAFIMPLEDKGKRSI